MPAGSDPVAADCHGDKVIQLLGAYGGSATSCTTNYLLTVATPLEVFFPTLLTWIEQHNALLRVWVMCMSLSGFEVVTHAARQPQVLFLIGPSTAARNQMLYLQLAQYQLLRTEAIPTTMAGRLAHSLFDFHAVVGFHEAG